MIAAVVFSRDRAMQLDALLRSLPSEFETAVVFRATSELHARSYEICAEDHCDIEWRDETKLYVPIRHQPYARDWFEDADFACFLTDDSVFYRQPRIPSRLGDQVLCHSFRLGRNTTWCYPHDREQRPPAFLEDRIASSNGILSWAWDGADGDYGYPGSLDGHVFRASHLRRSLLTCRADANPNQIEDHLNRWVKARLAGDYPLMTAEVESSLVGLPLNRVNQTHPNRWGERFIYHASDLCERYLAGERIALDRMDFSDVRGAHQEIPLVFEART